MNETFTTVGTFQFSAEALIVKGRLESEGVEVFMTDMHTIDTDPLVSNAIGGVKVKVRKEDEAKALQIIETILNYSTDDQGNAIHCPNCGSEKVLISSAVRSFAGLLKTLLFMLPVNKKNKFRCESCNTVFETE